MTVVNISELETLLGSAGPVTSGVVVATYWAGDAPFIRVDGDAVIFPTKIEVPVTLGELVVPLDLEPTDGVCCVKLEVRSYTDGLELERYVTIPATGPVDFEDLVDVDPSSFAPTEVTPTLVETIEQVLGDQVEPAVEAFLLANPPSSGFAHVQSTPVSSVPIPHTLGRLPAVTVYVGGAQVETDVTATLSAVTITFPTPTAFVAVIT